MGVNCSMKKVVVRGPALSQSGYGEHTRFVLRSLRSRQDLFDIYLININWGNMGWIWEDTEERAWLDSLLGKTIQHGQQGGQFDVSLQVTIPGEFERIAPVNIGVTAGVETTKISPQWLEKCLLMDKVITISEYSKHAFVSTEYEATNTATNQNFMAKVTCPVEVVGYPVKNVEMSAIELDLDTDFNFLTVGTWIPRKNMENTIKWFVEEFHDQEVGLVVKTNVGSNSVIDRDQSLQRLKDMIAEYSDRKCKVYLLHGDLERSQLTWLYNHDKIKCTINISHGEGFGLPLFEAAREGLPILSVPWSGHMDFLSHDGVNYFKDVKYELKQVQPEAVWNGVIREDAQWAFADQGSYKMSLRDIFKNWDSHNSRASELQTILETKFSREVIEKKFVDGVLGFDSSMLAREQEEAVMEFD